VDNLRPEARGPLNSGAWDGRPTCHPQTTPLVLLVTLSLTRGADIPQNTKKKYFTSSQNNTNMIQDDLKVSVHLIITIQKVTRNVQSVSRK
jgi:hypothetical protein